MKIALDQCKSGLSRHWQSNKIKANGHCFTVVSTIAECWQIKFQHVRCVWYVENWQQLVKSSANRWVEAGWTQQDIQLDCFTVYGVTLSVCIQESDYVYGMWDVEQFDKHVSQIFQRCKSVANKHNFLTRWVDSTPTSEVTPVTIWYVCFSFRGNRTTFGWDIANFIFDLENSRTRSRPR